MQAQCHIVDYELVPCMPLSLAKLEDIYTMLYLHDGKSWKDEPCS